MCATSVEMKMQMTEFQSSCEQSCLRGKNLLPDCNTYAYRTDKNITHKIKNIKPTKNKKKLFQKRSQKLYTYEPSTQILLFKKTSVSAFAKESLLNLSLLSPT